MEENYDLTQKILNLTFKQKDYQFRTQLIKPLSTFYDEVCSYLQIDPNNFTLYYRTKKLPIDSNASKTLLSDIIKPNEEPNFQITSNILKKPKTLKLRSETIEGNSRTKKRAPTFRTVANGKSSKTIKINNDRYQNMYDNNNNEPMLKKGKIGVIISQIPSVEDVKKILDEYDINQGNNNNLNPKTNNNFYNKQGVLSVLGNNSVRIDFQDEIKLNDFISYISYIKYQNPHYKSIIIKKDNSEVKNNLRNLSYSQKNIKKNLSIFNKRYNYNNINTIQSTHITNKININDVIKALKQNELNHECYHGLTLERDGEDEIVTDYYKQQDFIRNSSPYITENEKRILEERENRKHFFDHKKNFVTSVGKYSMKPNYIPNYVGMTPSENPNNHEFRNVDKTKWRTNKGFNV